MTPTIRDVRAQGCELELPAEPRAVSAARRFVTTTLQTWQVSADVIEAAELVVSELTTNAVERTLLLTPRMAGEVEPEPPDGTTVVWVRVRLHGSGTVIEVWDGDQTPPVMQSQSLDAEHGRGLFLVAELSRQWGCYWPGIGGKVVWAMMG